MAQGIMTGTGFLGAGVIFKEGLMVRGLTTAASIWITAAIGILVGIGFYVPVVAATGRNSLSAVRVTARCDFGKYDAMKTIGECVYSAELDMRTLVFTRGLAFPLSELAHD
jgi:hypothetical protein